MNTVLLRQSSVRLRRHCHAGPSRLRNLSRSFRSSLSLLFTFAFIVRLILLVFASFVEVHTQSITMTPLTFFRSLLLVVLSSSAFAGTYDQLCCLCDGCKAPVNGRGTKHVDQYGKTCNSVMLEMADKFSPYSSQCTSSVSSYRQRCCDASYNAAPVAQAPTPSPASSYPQGSYPKCTLCHSGQFPEKPTTLTAILGIPGNPTCRDLYYMGIKGQISDQLCNPMQDYMDAPCGCYDKTPNPNASSNSATAGGSPNYPSNSASAGGDPANHATKKNADDDNKDDSKMSDQKVPSQGGIRRKRILRGS